MIKITTMPYQKSPETCPVCQKEADFKFIQDYKNEWGEWSLYECSKCQVQFWIPFENPRAKQYEEDVDYTSKSEILTKENCWLIVKDYWNMNQFLKHPPYQNPKGKKLLDVGCGTGEFLYVMQGSGYEACGVDFNKNAIELARKNLGIKNIYQDDVINFLKDKIEEYDIITAFEILEHLDNPKRFVELIYQALKPGGYFAVSLPNRNRYFGKINPELEIWDFPYQHLTRWSPLSFKHFLEKHHFKIVILKKESPVNWFISRLRFFIESLTKKNQKSDFGPIEKVRSNIGLRKYKLVKSLIKLLFYPFALLCYIFKFEGGEIYILAKK